jgi:predicted RNase H-like nuclease (RuvC/YqgF family)
MAYTSRQIVNKYERALEEKKEAVRTLVRSNNAIEVCKRIIQSQEENIIHLTALISKSNEQKLFSEATIEALKNKYEDAKDCVRKQERTDKRIEVLSRNINILKKWRKVMA